MSKVKNELEELAFKYLEPQAYEALRIKVDLKRRAAEGLIQQLKGTIEAKLREAQDHAVRAQELETALAAAATRAEELQAELIVMGTIRHAGIEGILIGNTAETILHRIDCSVLAVKPEGFVTPVTI